MKYFLNESSGGTITFTPKTGTANPFNGFDSGNFSTPAFADVDEDGDPDLVVGESQGTLKYFLNESSGGTITFTPKTVSTDNPFNGLDVGEKSAPGFTDINGDGKLDLVVGGYSGKLNYFLNESATNSIVFTQKTSNANPLKNIYVVYYAAPTFADIDGDGKLDLVVGGYGGTLQYFLNESTTSILNSLVFTQKTSSANPFNGISVGNNAAPAFADVDGDSDLDLVVGGVGGTLKYFLNESSGGTITFTPKTGQVITHLIVLMLETMLLRHLLI